MQPAWGSLLLLAFPSFTETPLRPPSSELPASLPASPRQDRERQACYRLVLSPQRLPLITSWGGQQKAGRTPGRTVFLRKAPGPAAHTGASSGRHLPPHWPPPNPPDLSGREGGIPKHHTATLDRHESDCVSAQGFLSENTVNWEL